MVNDSPPGMLAATVVVRIVEYCRQRGHDPKRLCAAAGVSLELLSEPGARVTYAVAERLGLRALEATADEDFGLHLAASVQDSGNFDVGMLVLMASPTVRVALEKFIAKQRYWGDGERATLHPAGASAAIRYCLSGGGGLYARHADECALAEITLGVRVLSGLPLNPSVVRFRHREPASTREHARVFCCPIEFESRFTEVVFDAHVLDARMQHANDAFLSIFERQMESAIARLPLAANASAAVRSVARAALASGGCSLAETGRTLGMSPRTLQRRLRDEGTSFAEVVDALRREMAVAYLQRGLAIGDVAGLLGYADTTAFHHAFRRWTGASPARYVSAPPRQ